MARVVAFQAQDLAAAHFDHGVATASPFDQPIRPDFQDKAGIHLRSLMATAGKSLLLERSAYPRGSQRIISARGDIPTSLVRQSAWADQVPLRQMLRVSAGVIGVSSKLKQGPDLMTL